MDKYGTIISFEMDKAILMTEDCSFIYIKSRPCMHPGQEIAYGKKDLYYKSNVKIIFYSLVGLISILVLMFFLSRLFR